MTYEIIVLSVPDILLFFVVLLPVCPHLGHTHTQTHTCLNDDICMLPSMRVLIQKRWGDKYVMDKHPQNRGMDRWMGSY